MNELISNALKHAFPDQRRGAVRVELRCSDSQVTLLVSDDGVGMPAHFELSSPNSLGMSLVSKLVEQLDGRLAIVGAEGTCFRVTFPQGAAS